MTEETVPLSVLLDTRRQLIENFGARARAPAARDFLLSFHALAPDWPLLGLEADIAALPAVQWKLRNLERLRAEQPRKFDAEPGRLAAVLAA